MRRGILRLLALFTVLLLVAAACGDSGEPTTTGAGGSGGTSSSNDDGDGDGNDDLSTITLGTIGNIPGVSGECEALAEVFIGMAQIFVTGVDADELFGSAAASLPSSLQGDIAAVANAAQQYMDALDDLGIDPLDPTSLASLSPAEQQQFAEAAEVFSSPEVEAAFDNLEAYGEAECANIGLGN